MRERTSLNDQINSLKDQLAAAQSSMQASHAGNTSSLTKLQQDFAALSTQAEGACATRERGCGPAHSAQVQGAVLACRPPCARLAVRARLPHMHALRRRGQGEQGPVRGDGAQAEREPRHDEPGAAGRGRQPGDAASGGEAGALPR